MFDDFVCVKAAVELDECYLVDVQDRFSANLDIASLVKPLCGAFQFNLERFSQHLGNLQQFVI